MAFPRQGRRLRRDSLLARGSHCRDDALSPDLDPQFPQPPRQEQQRVLASAELAAIASKLGSTPTLAEYNTDMGTINNDGVSIYRYMSFDKIDEIQGSRG